MDEYQENTLLLKAQGKNLLQNPIPTYCIGLMIGVAYSIYYPYPILLEMFNSKNSFEIILP